MGPRYPSNTAMTLNSLEGKVRMDWTAEEELVRKAKIGDLAAFDQLAHRYRPAVTLTARSVLNNRELAEDAVQDGLIAAYKSLPQLADAARFGPWLSSIVRNRSLRIRSGERTGHMPIDDLIAAHIPSIQQRLEEESDQAEVRCAIRQLPKEIQDIVLLYYLHLWSVGDIARYLDLPNTTVKWRLHAGRQQLRTLLSDSNEEPK